ncbi:MAG: hypothetical protein L0216_00440 [Planctomycetales bacterium]|nr:hypothetical protein [Planctomycetales bacterium]
MGTMRWIRTACAGIAALLAALALAAPPAAAQSAREKEGEKAIAAFEKWYRAHPDDFDDAEERLEKIMEDFAGTEIAGQARLRMKSVEADRESAAGRAYEKILAEAQAKLETGDVAGSIDAFKKFPAVFLITSWGQKAKEWPGEVAKRGVALVKSHLEKARKLSDAGDHAGAKAAAEKAEAGSKSLKGTLPPDDYAPLESEVAETKNGVALTAETAAQGEKWRGMVGADMGEAASKADAGEFDKALEICERIRKAIGAPKPGERGIRRQAEDLWIRCATEMSGLKAHYMGEAQKTPYGTRIIYKFESPDELKDWSDPEGGTVAAGRLKVPSAGILWHKARFPGGVSVILHASAGEVLGVMIGDPSSDAGYKVIVGVGGKAKITRGAAGGPWENTGPPVENDADVTVALEGGVIRVNWGGRDVLKVKDAEPPPASAVEKVALFGGALGFAVDEVSVSGDAQIGGGGGAAGDGASGKGAASTLPKGTMQLRRPGSGQGLLGWKQIGTANWNARGEVEVQCENYWIGGSGRNESLAMLLHREVPKYTFTEYEFGCELRFVRHQAGSEPGIIFPVGQNYVMWIFSEGGAEIHGIEGVEPKGTLAKGTANYLPVSVKVEKGMVRGFIGGQKSWEAKMGSAKISTPSGIPELGTGLVNRKGVTAYKNPWIKFIK